jgi:hypothetical protein
LHDKVREAPGEGPGDTLMSLLPPVGWADVATKDDVAVLKADLVALEERLEGRLVALEGRLMAQFHREMNRQIWSMLGLAVAVAAVLTANNVW